MFYKLLRPLFLCFLFTQCTSILWGQELVLPFTPKPTPAPKKYKAPTPKPTPSRPEISAKTYAQSYLKVKMDVSAKLIINVETDGTNLRNEIVIASSDVNTYVEEKIYNGDATLEVKLPNGKSFRYDQYVSINSDLSTLDVMFNNGLLDVKTKTKTQLLEEKRQSQIQMANDLVTSLRSSVFNLTEYAVSQLDYKNSVDQLRNKDLIDPKLHTSCLELLSAIQKSQESYFKVKGKAVNVNFYGTNENYPLVYAARTDYSALQNSYNKAYEQWQYTSYSNSFLNRVNEYIEFVGSEVSQFPDSKDAFSKKVAQTLANWEKIKAEEERKRKEILDRLEAERKAKILREQEEARRREEQLRIEQERYRVWTNRSGAYLSASIPLGLELGVLATDRSGNVFGVRYRSNDDETIRIQIHNCVTFPISGPIQAGVTFGLGAEENKKSVGNPNPKFEFSENSWNYGVSFGGRIMYVDHKFMGGVEYLYGHESASGIFFVAGFRIGDL